MTLNFDLCEVVKWPWSVPSSDSEVNPQVLPGTVILWLCCVPMNQHVVCLNSKWLIKNRTLWYFLWKSQGPMLTRHLFTIIYPRKIMDKAYDLGFTALFVVFIVNYCLIYKRIKYFTEMMQKAMIESLFSADFYLSMYTSFSHSILAFYML